MALILDKTHRTLILDESGNTVSNELTNVNYTDQYGNVYDNPYLVIDDLGINKLNKTFRINISIYKDKSSRTNNNRPLYINFFTMSEPDIYDNYFSISKLESSNIFAQSYLYVKEIHYPGWKSDE